MPRRRSDTGSGPSMSPLSPLDVPYRDEEEPNTTLPDTEERAAQQAEIDSGFFTASPGNPRPETVASRFRRRRTPSDASIDSALGFIDHRQQSYSQPRSLPSGLSRSRPFTARALSSHTHSTDLPADPAADGQLGGSALDDRHPGLNEDELVMDHRPEGTSPSASDLPDRIISPPLSRHGSHSDMANAEEDVCFPMLNEPMQPAANETFNEPPPTHPTKANTSNPRPQGRGLPGVLPNFPFSFDFATLEEFAQAEREANGYFTKSAPEQSDGVRTGPSVSFSPDRGDIRRRTGVNGDGEVKSGRLGRMRKLSESVATPAARGGRHQRKLALFEGGATTNEGFGARSTAHAKTPLLSDKERRGTMSSIYGTHSKMTPGSHFSDEKERPYRFSFYSNAISSTIHSRYISELPNDDQTFENLFVGHRPEEDQWDDSTAADESSSQVPPFTPQLSNGNIPSQPHSSRTSIHNGQSGRNLGLGSNLPSGIAGGNGHVMIPKQGLIRTDNDAEGNTWWLDVLCPTDAEMKCLAKVFGIHPLTTEDIQMEESREKIELFRNYYFVCFRSFDQDPYSPTYLEPLNMYVVVFREGILTFHYRGTPHCQNVRRRIKQLKDFINVTSDWISYALIDDITDAFGPLIQSIEYEVDSIDELVLILKDAEQSDMLRRIGTCRKKVMGLLRLIGQKADVVKGLSKRCNENWSVAPKSDIGLYLSDIQDHLVTMTQNLNHYEKILSRSHSNYLAQISIEMTDANNAINEVLSKLTALGTVLVPMNLITGLWGMNVLVPGQDVDNLRWFFSIVAVLVAIAVIGGWATWRAIRA